ncbi:MAG: hypothetical protein K2Y17_01310 [Qipengyuania sp.]|nr:hypothetical protein [Qipengyuania sp.]
MRVETARRGRGDRRGLFARGAPGGGLREVDAGRGAGGGGEKQDHVATPKGSKSTACTGVVTSGFR